MLVGDGDYYTNYTTHRTLSTDADARFSLVSDGTEAEEKARREVKGGGRTLLPVHVHYLSLLLGGHEEAVLYRVAAAAAAVAAAADVAACGVGDEAKRRCVCVWGGSFERFGDNSSQREISGGPLIAD